MHLDIPDDIAEASQLGEAELRSNWLLRFMRLKNYSLGKPGGFPV